MLHETNATVDLTKNTESEREGKEGSNKKTPTLKAIAESSKRSREGEETVAGIVLEKIASTGPELFGPRLLVRRPVFRRLGNSKNQGTRPNITAGQNRAKDLRDSKISNGANPNLDQEEAEREGIQTGNNEATVAVQIIQFGESPTAIDVPMDGEMGTKV